MPGPLPGASRHQLERAVSGVCVGGSGVDARLRRQVPARAATLEAGIGHQVDGGRRGGERGVRAAGALPRTIDARDLKVIGRAAGKARQPE